MYATLHNSLSVIIIYCKGHNDRKCLWSLTIAHAFRIENALGGQAASWLTENFITIVCAFLKFLISE